MPIELPQYPTIGGADVRRIRDIYSVYRYNGEPDGWDVDDYKDLNFRKMMELTRFTGIPACASSALDVGCGTGDFYTVWSANGGREYTGIDLLPMQVVDANLAHPQEPKLFRHGDFLREDFDSQYDYVFASGALTVRLDDIDKGVYLHAMLAKMVSLARVGVYINFHHDPDNWFINSQTHWGFTIREVAQTLNKIEKEQAVALHSAVELTPNPRHLQQAHYYIWK